MLTRSTYMLLLLLALLLGTASFFIHQSDYPLTYDEGDYFVAVQSGMWTNWTDADDISIVEFVRKGVAAVQDAESRAALSDWIRNSGSTMFYRHYHPPLAFYPAIALQPLTGALPLHWQLRLSNLFWLLAWIAALAWIGWRRADARTPAVLLLPASSAWAMAVVGYNMHLPFGMLASLFFWCWFLGEDRGGTERIGEDREGSIEDGRLRSPEATGSAVAPRVSVGTDGAKAPLPPSSQPDRSEPADGRPYRGTDPVMRRAAQFFLAAAFATVEYGMFVLFFIVLWGAIAWWRSDDRRGFLRGALASAGWVVLFLALLWPAGVINLNLLKSWTFVMYVALFRLSGEPVAFEGWWTLVIDKWNANPVELLLLAVLLGATLWRWRDLLRRGSLFAASGFIAALLYLQVNPTLVYRWYLFPAFAVGFLFLGSVWMRGRETEDDSTSPRAVPAGGGDVSRGESTEDDSTSPRVVPAGGGDVSRGESTKERSFIGALSSLLAVALFLAAWWLVPEPDYTELKQLHVVVDRALAGSDAGADATPHLTVPRSVLPQLQPYHPDAVFVSYHDVEYAGMALQDSIPQWRERGLVLVPADADLGGLEPDGEVGQYAWFEKRETNDRHPLALPSPELSIPRNGRILP